MGPRRNVHSYRAAAHLHRVRAPDLAAKRGGCHVAATRDRRAAAAHGAVSRGDGSRSRADRRRSALSDSPLHRRRRRPGTGRRLGAADREKAPEYPGSTALAERYSRFVLRQPAVESLQLRVQALRLADAPRVAAILLELAVELEHVAEIVGAGKSERPERRWGHGVVLHFLTQRLRQRLRHLRAAEMSAGDADGLADHLVTLLEYRVCRLANVFGGDARQLLGAEGQCDRELAVGAFLGTHAEVDEVVPVE